MFENSIDEDRKIGYMCLTDYDHELESASGGCKIYPSITELKKNKKCWQDCGIIKVEVVIKERLKN
jgi:hypothetical protein